MNIFFHVGTQLSHYESTDKKPALVSLLTVVVVVLFLALSSTVVYFVVIRPKRIAAITDRLDRLASVSIKQGIILCVTTEMQYVCPAST